MTRTGTTHAPRTLVERVRAPLLIFLFSFVVLSLFSGDRFWRASPDNHFVYLADSMLHGTLEVRGNPPHGNDWASIDTLTLRSGETMRGMWWDRSEGKFLTTTGEFFDLSPLEMRGMQQDRTYYVSFPPTPSLLMMPGVLLWGMSFNDVIFTIFFASLNVSLFWLLLRDLYERGRIRLLSTDRLWLTAMFGFGTAHLWCSVQGAVWFTALVVGVTFTLLYMRAAIDARAPFWAGIFLGIAFAARTPLLYSVLFFAAFFFFPDGRLRRDWGARFWVDGIKFAIGPLVVGLLLLWMNAVRFDDPGEFGHRYLAAGQIDRIKEYGLFNVHFLGRNLLAALALVPQFLPREPYVQISQHGMALWFSTPAFLYFLTPRSPGERIDRVWLYIFALTLASIALPHIFYQNTGWVQFGYRFSMDYLPYLVILLAFGRDRLSAFFKALIVLGFAVNAFGAITFGRMAQFYGDWWIEP
jgi:hypothetical protein